MNLVQQTTTAAVAFAVMRGRHQVGAVPSSELLSGLLKHDNQMKMSALPRLKGSRLVQIRSSTKSIPLTVPELAARRASCERRVHVQVRCGEVLPVSVQSKNLF